jgi:hypothetical protein
MTGTDLKTKARPAPESRRLGDARVSTYGQTLDAQLEQLRRDGCTRIYREKVSGPQADRRELLQMLKAIAASDVVTVTRIDRLARSTFDLLAIVKQIVDAGGQFRSLAEPWADTSTSTGRLMIAILRKEGIGAELQCRTGDDFAAGGVTVSVAQRMGSETAWAGCHAQAHRRVSQPVGKWSHLHVGLQDTLKWLTPMKARLKGHGRWKCSIWLKRFQPQAIYGNPSRRQLFYGREPGYTGPDGGAYVCPYLVYQQRSYRHASDES